MSTIYYTEPPTSGKVILETTFGNDMFLAFSYLFRRIGS